MEATLREEASGSARMDRRLSQYRVAWVTMPNGSEQSLMMEVGASFLELPELRPGDTYNVLAYAVYTFAPAAGAGMEAVEESAASSPCEVTVPLLSEPTDMTLLEHLGHAAKLRDDLLHAHALEMLLLSASEFIGFQLRFEVSV